MKSTASNAFAARKKQFRKSRDKKELRSRTIRRVHYPPTDRHFSSSFFRLLLASISGRSIFMAKPIYPINLCIIDHFIPFISVHSFRSKTPFVHFVFASISFVDDRMPFDMHQNAFHNIQNWSAADANMTFAAIAVASNANDYYYFMVQLDVIFRGRIWALMELQRASYAKAHFPFYPVDSSSAVRGNHNPYTRSAVRRDLHANCIIIAFIVGQ